MANMKNAKKAVRKNIKRTVENNNFEASMRTAVKNVEKAAANLKVAIKRIDKAVASGVTTKNKSARSKARLTKKVNSME